MPSEIKLSVDKNARYYVWLALQTRQSCHESPVVQFNIRVTTLAGHEDALRGSQSDHSAECLFWSLQSLDMAIHPSNLWTPFRLSSVLFLSPLCTVVGGGCLHPQLARSMFLFSAYLQSCFWSAWCRLQLNKRPCALAPPSSPAPSAAPIILKWIRHRCHCWRDSQTTSLVLWQQEV